MHSKKNQLQPLCGRFGFSTTAYSLHKSTVVTQSNALDQYSSEYVSLLSKKLHSYLLVSLYLFFYGLISRVK
jgi:hypothetical protein